MGRGIMRKEIFVVHSDVEIRNFLQECAKNLGFKITALSSYKRLFNLLRHRKPTAVIIDPLIYNFHYSKVSLDVKRIDANIKLIAIPSDKGMNWIAKHILDNLQEKTFPNHAEQELNKNRGGILVERKSD